MRLAIETGLDETARLAGYSGANTSITEIIGNGLNIILGAVGLAFFIYIVYAGIIWMTAAGDETKIKNARATIINSTIAVVVIVGAMTIATFVTSALSTAVGVSN